MFDNGLSGLLLAVAIVFVGFLALVATFGPVVSQVVNVIP